MKRLRGKSGNDANEARDLHRNINFPSATASIHLIIVLYAATVTLPHTHTPSIGQHVGLPTLCLLTLSLGDGSARRHKQTSSRLSSHPVTFDFQVSSFFFPPPFLTPLSFAVPD